MKKFALASLVVLLPILGGAVPEQEDAVGLKAPPVNRTPRWAAETVWYQIFPTRFRNGDPANDPTVDTLEYPVRPSSKWKITPWTGDWYARADWERELGDNFYDNGVLDRRYGGDLQGVLDKLDYLKNTGINGIYFNPLFDSRSLHKYDGNSFHHIDPNFGPDPRGDRELVKTETNDPATWQWTAADKLFLEVLKQAHARRMHVIIDGVFNHTGRDFFAFRDLRRNQAKSPYKNWYVVKEFDDPKTERNEFRYEGWWGHTTLPEFRKTAENLNPGPRKYIFDSVRRWMDPDGDGDPVDGIDGWRLDVADEVPVGFWKQWNAHVRSINPAAYTVCETWKNAVPLIENGGFSASMNYHAFSMPVKGFFIDSRLTAPQFGELLNKRRQELPEASTFVMQNLVDSHDTDRVASMIMNPSKEAYEPEQVPYDKANKPGAPGSEYDITKPTAKARAIQRMIVLMQMTYVGAPMIYYGTEAGMWGADDPDDRMPMVWADMKFDPQAGDPRGKARTPDDVNFDKVIYEFYRQVIQLRRDYRALNHGEYSLVETGAGDRAFAFSRDLPDQRLLIVFNRNEEAASIPLKLGEAAAHFAKPVMIFTTANSAEGVAFEPTAEGLTVKMPPLTGIVIGGR